jgi:flagellar capping protein FliD
MTYQSSVSIEGNKIVPKFSNTGLSIKQMVDMKLVRAKQAIKKEETKAENLELKIKKIDLLINNINKIIQPLVSLKTPNFDDPANKLKDLFIAKNINMLSSNEVTHPADKCLEVYSTAMTPGKYDITINQIAIAKQENYLGFSTIDDDVVNGASGMFTPGIFEINNHMLTLEGGENLQEIRDIIKATSSYTNVSSNINKLSNNAYILSIHSLNTGYNYSFDINDIEGVFANVNVETINAQDAEFTINNNDYVRASNVINDILVNGEFSIKLLRETNLEVISVNSDIDLQLIKSKIKELVSNINILFDIIYIEKDKQLQPNNLGNYTLWSEHQVRDITNQLPAIISSNINKLNDNDFLSLKDIGITLDVKLNKNSYETYLKIDDSKLSDSLINNHDSVKNLLYTQISSNNTNVKFLYATKPINLQNFQLDIDLNRPLIQIDNNTIQDRVRVTINNNIYRPNHYLATNTIVGLPDTPISGLGLRFENNENAIIQVNISQGIADRIFNFFNKYIADSTTELVPKIVDNQKKYNIDGNLEMTPNKEKISLLTNTKTQYTKALDEQKTKIFNLQEKLSDLTKSETKRITSLSNKHQNSNTAIDMIENMRQNNKN